MLDSPDDGVMDVVRVERVYFESVAGGYGSREVPSRVQVTGRRHVTVGALDAPDFPFGSSRIGANNEYPALDTVCVLGKVG
jgi:hypothetical protein